LFAIVAKSHSVKNDDDVYYPENWQLESRKFDSNNN
jgi:hypothetical protein